MSARLPFSKPTVSPEIDRAADTAPGDAPAAPEPRLENLLGEAIDVRTLALVGLFVLAVIYTLHLARALILPIVLAILLDFLLSPFIRFLKRLRIPEPVGATLVMLGFLGAVGATVYGLSEPASEWVARAPESFDRIQAKLAELRQPMEQVTRAAEQVEAATDMGGEQTPSVQIQGPSLTKQIFGGTTAFLGAAATVVFLTFFLLAAGDLFLTKLIRVLPQFKDKRRAVTIAREIEGQVSTHLFTITLINIGLGIVTGFAVKLLGMPNPVLWGVVAGVLNYVPYVGAVATTAILALASLVVFETPMRALLVPAVYFAINSLEGNLITPMILGHRLTLNTVALFIGLIFWWYIWGIPGAILAVPMMATIKIFCDHFESLASVGEFLGK